jgi:hypothetical protein
VPVTRASSTRLLGTLVAALLPAAVVLLGGTAPAQAATCASAEGVSVVVDGSDVGGSVATSCVAGGGGQSAASLFDSAGHVLTRVTSEPGAVCRVDGMPGSAGCERMPPANAFWGLFWSDGSGGWVFASEGVDGLNVPAGGSVAFAWQDGGEYDYPGVAAPQHAEESSPSPSPSDGGSTGGSGGSGGGSTGAGAGAGDAAGPGQGRSGSSSPSASPTDTASDDPAPSAGTGDRSDRRSEGGARNAASETEAEAKQERREKRKDARSTEPGAEDGAGDGADGADAGDRATADPTDPSAAEAGSGRVPLWVTLLVLVVLALAAVTVVLRRRAAAGGDVTP